MKHRFITIIILLLSVSAVAEIAAAEPMTTRKERNYILKANEAFNEKDYEKAIELYNMALGINPASERAKFNLAVSMVKRADEIGGAGGNDHNISPAAPNAADSLSLGMKQSANKIFNELYEGSTDKLTRENSAYNSGNLFFSENELSQSIEQYKKALRLNPANDNARHNLRVAQLRLQQQQNQDDNEDQQDKQDEQQQKEQQEQEQQQQQQQPQPQPQAPQPKQSNSENILNAAQQNESKTRQRLEKQQVPVAPRYHNKPW
ncbi:MAG: tetratricopeptide repeat protein [Muribaculaceae bacterium]|nr:tetratricopeptide repeat protein [Muribaculaceae bacterium]MDE6345397.1 tetratricopeptide repeat protein [Muribaculaceae bacterium]